MLSGDVDCAVGILECKPLCPACGNGQKQSPRRRVTESNLMDSRSRFCIVDIDMTYQRDDKLRAYHVFRSGVVVRYELLARDTMSYFATWGEAFVLQR